MYKKKTTNTNAESMTKEQILGLYKQIKWERDIAIEQLHDIGKELGEKMDDVRKVIFCKDCKYWTEEQTCAESSADPFECPERNADDFCSRGERKTEKTDRVLMAKQKSVK